MLFASIEFIFFFLPICFFIYWLLKKNQLQNLFLLLASIFFYFWGEAWLIGVLFITVITSYFIALSQKKTLLIFGVAFNLSLLIYFKYSGLSSHLPLGISFFVFHAISYLMDVYRGKIVAEKRFSIVSLYFFLFPHQIAGPIVRYEQFAINADKRSIKTNDLYAGIERFIQGLAKKVLIANSVAKSADSIFALSQNDLSSPLAWVGAICYTIQIYFDFSGYSDMAIGLARMFGFHFHENFNFPYAAKSITDFWRRWHISLSSWFRDYLYIPLGGNRVSKSRTYANLIIVFLLVGLWHGANWTFVIWGLWHGTFLIFERLYKPLTHFGTMLVVVLGWVIFRADSIEHALHFINRMFSFTHTSGVAYQAVIDNVTVLGILLGVAFSTGHLNHFVRRHLAKLPGAYESVLLLLFVLSMSRLAGATFNPFIYFRF